MFPISQPYPHFTDIDGGELNNGYVYIGTAGLNPETNPIAVYWDTNGTEAAQPIRTINGYLSRNGSAAAAYYSATDFSIVVKNQNRALVTSSLNASGLNYLNRLIPIIVDTYAELGSTAGVVNQIIETRGHTVAGKGANRFIAKSGSVTNDYGTKINSATSNIYWELIECPVLDAYMFGVIGDGSTEDYTAAQRAIDAAIAREDDLMFKGATYKISTQLLVDNTSIKIYGQGRYASTIDSFVTGAVFKCTRWGGTIAGFECYVNNATGHFIEAGNVSRNCRIEDIYAQVRGAYAASATGSFIYLNAFDDTDGFSGGLGIYNCYGLQFKYGVRFRGNTPLGENTWTSVCLYNVWLVGRAGGVIGGSAGIYMNAGTNGIGTLMMGGTIEGYSYPIVVENGSFGGVFETDIEANTNPPLLGTAFCGRVVNASGVPTRSQSIDSGTAWYKNECVTGGGPISESYYKTKQVLTSGNIDNVAWETYHNDSLIDGNSVGTYGLKFQVGIGQGSSAGAAAHPSQHFIRLGDNKISWGPDSPAARAGAQIVAWKQGDICYNMNATVGQPIGWMCSVAGTPGTWVALANL